MGEAGLAVAGTSGVFVGCLAFERLARHPCLMEAAEFMSLESRGETMDKTRAWEARCEQGE